ncbi:MAG: amidohydrolase family protein [Trueperaceae bacterium]|nr:amidohydrolase family protein [Trueperaceae bacterium]
MIDRKLLTADVVYNGLGIPRLGAGVALQTVQAETQIIAVDELEQLKSQFPDARLENAGLALSPAPVNAHMHLDLSSMPFSPGSYEDFIRKVIGHDRSGKRNLEAAKDGIIQLQKQGIDTIGDIVTEEDVMVYLLRSELKGVAYWEVFAPDPADADQEFNETVRLLKRFKELERPGGMRVGLSPHTPHTVSEPLLKKLVTLAKQNQLPLQIHVAESAHELALYKDASGPLWELYKPFMPYWQAPGVSPVQYLKELNVLEAQPTLIHMVNVDENDVKAVQTSGCVVVHCPRSNTALECGRFPWELYAKHGITVALGTDSSGSSPNLVLAEELQAARNLHGEKASLQGLIWSAVKGGYRALGMNPPKLTRGTNASELYIWT